MDIRCFGPKAREGPPLETSVSEGRERSEEVYTSHFQRSLIAKLKYLLTHLYHQIIKSGVFCFFFSIFHPDETRENTPLLANKAIIKTQKETLVGY